MTPFALKMCEKSIVAPTGFDRDYTLAAKGLIKVA
jgi:hypothetical protein